MSIQRTAEFETNVFINCPFDDEFKPLLRILLFVARKVGLQPRIASEKFNSADIRLNKILEIILESKYSIHDLSRNKSKKAKETFRMNMPFELGLDYGVFQFHDDVKYRNKTMLILEDEAYSLKSAISDISFADCKPHKNDAEQLVEEVRNWFVENGFTDIQGPSMIWDEFNEFNAELYNRKTKEGFKSNQVDRLSIPEYLEAINDWLINPL